MDKRDLSTIFRERLKLLLTRSDLNQSAFATAVGIDRSALSQLLSGASTRLPRAETLLNIAAEFKVSLDWLLGLSQDEGVTGEIRESLEIEEAPDGFDRTLLAKWHAEAVGTKIRYVPGHERLSFRNTFRNSRPARTRSCRWAERALRVAISFRASRRLV